jgi:molybdopterin molybdotransferase
LIPLEQALAIVLAGAKLLPLEDVALEDALGRVLAEGVAADADLPPFDRSAMDGYALRAEDVQAPPTWLHVAGQIRAGLPPGPPLLPGTAIQIMTGAPVPAGANAVQQVEKTRVAEGGLEVEIQEAVAPGQNIARRASEVRAGEAVIESGRVIDPSTLAVLAAVGQARVRVGRRPRVAVVVTGDELVDVSDAPDPGQIRNSNGPAVVAQARLAGAEPRSLGVMQDDSSRIAAAIVEGLKDDVLVLSGGVSAGAFDLVESALVAQGVTLLFTKVAIKPGAPLVFGKRSDTLVFGLPGNPVSAQVTFDLFVRPALLRMQGATTIARPTLLAELGEAVKNRSGRQAHLPAHLRFEGGRFVARPLRSMGSADLVAHARANALVVLDAERTQAEAGEFVPVLLLGNFLDRDGSG